MIDIQLKGADEALKKLATIPNGIEKAANRAINRTATSARAIVAREISKQYYVKITDIKKTIQLRRSNRKSLSAELISRGGVIALSKYKVSPRGVQHRGSKNRPLRVAVKKGAGKKTIGSAFIAQFKSGHVGVVHRKGKRRFPLQELYGPSIPQMLKNENVIGPVKEQTATRLQKEFEHEAGRVIEKGK